MTAEIKEIVDQLTEKFEKSRKIVWKTSKGLELKIQILVNETEEEDIPYFLKKGTPVAFRLERSGNPPRMYHSIEALARALLYETA